LGEHMYTMGSGMNDNQPAIRVKTANLSSSWAYEVHKIREDECNFTQKKSGLGPLLCFKQNILFRNGKG
jgi:hypothetical protein